MISIGAHALRPDGTFSTFSANILPIEGATTDPKTMEWWQTQPKALAAVSINQRPAAEVMAEFVAWVEKLPFTPVFVGWPIAFDWMFVAYYCHRFVGRNPFGYEGIDVKSYVAGMQNTPYLQTTKYNMPDEWFPENTQRHVAVADAIEQGVIFKNILEHNAMLAKHVQDIEVRYRELSQAMDDVFKKLHTTEAGLIRVSTDPKNEESVHD